LDVPRPDVSPGEVILEVKNLTVESDTKGVMAVDNVSFHIRAGEIYGIAGVEGNGQAELIEAIYGLRQPRKGQIVIKGEDITGKPTHVIRKKGVSHIPGDRHKFGVFLPFTLADNSILGHHREEAFAKYGIFRRFSNISKWAMEIIKKFDVRTPSEKVPMSALSGGNQQKFVVGREISFEHELMIAAHPTRGVDIGAMEFIYRQLFEEKKQNKAILLVSADLDELLLLSDRIGVMFKGKIIKELDNTNRQVTPKEVGYYMLGGDLEAHEDSDIAGGDLSA
jgi:simple sugar transport system ATP-binding protein